MKNVLKAVGAMIMGSGAQLISNALAGFLATAWLPLAERGLMVLILSLTSIVALLSTAGLGNALRARLPRLSGAEAQQMSMVYTTAGVVVLAVGILAGGAASYMLQAIDSQMGSVPVVLAVLLAAVVQTSTTLLTDARFAAGRFAEGAKWAAASAIFGLFGMVLMEAVFMALGVPATAAAFILAQYGAMTLVTIVSLRGALRAGYLAMGRVHGAQVWELIRRGLATMILPLAIVIITRADRVILGAATTAVAVAIYGLAATYTEMLRVVPTAIAQISTLRVAKGGGWKSVSGLALMSLVMTTSMAALLWVCVKVFTVPLFGEEYEPAVQLTLIMLPAEVLYSLIILGNLILIGGQWVRISTAIGVVASTVAVGLYIAGAAIGETAGLAITRNLVFALLAVAVSGAVCFCFARQRRSAEAIEEA